MNSQFQQALDKAILKDAHLLWHESIRVISVFDDVRYDRSDIDILGPGMRRHVSKFLIQLGCKARSGGRIVEPDSGLNFVLPKPSILAASPFDITRYHQRGADDIYILTPTQTAAYYFQAMDFDLAIMAIAGLIQTQPVNLLKLLDTLEHHRERKCYEPVLHYLLACQKHAVKQGGMKFKRSLGAVFG